jgi:kanamycin kinase
VGEGLRALHDRAPVDECPFSWSVDERTSLAVDRLERGLTTPEQWHEEHHHLGATTVHTLLEHPPPVDQLVVCHGDACAPNTLVADDGNFAGLVDLGNVGVADRWADLAIATWSVTWNHGPGWEPLVLEAYGVEPDPIRIAFHRLLWDLT